MGHKYEEQDVETLANLAESLLASSEKLAAISNRLLVAGIKTAYFPWVNATYTALKTVQDAIKFGELAADSQIEAKKLNRPNPFIKIKMKSANERARRTTSAPPGVKGPGRPRKP